MLTINKKKRQREKVSKAKKRKTIYCFIKFSNKHNKPIGNIFLIFILSFSSHPPFLPLWYYFHKKYAHIIYSSVSWLLYFIKESSIPSSAHKKGGKLTGKVIICRSLVFYYNFSFSFIISHIVTIILLFYVSSLILYYYFHIEN